MTDFGMMFKTNASCFKFGLWSTKFIWIFNLGFIFLFDYFLLALSYFETGGGRRDFGESEIKLICI